MRRLYNIKRLACWKDLEAMGFKTCRFNFRDCYLIGATRQMKDGTEIVIEPLLVRTGTQNQQDLHIHHLSTETPLNMVTMAKYFYPNLVRHLKTVVSKTNSFKIFKE